MLRHRLTAEPQKQIWQSTQCQQRKQSKLWLLSEGDGDQAETRQNTTRKRVGAAPLVVGGDVTKLSRTQRHTAYCRRECDNPGAAAGRLAVLGARRCRVHTDLRLSSACRIRKGEQSRGASSTGLV